VMCEILMKMRIKRIRRRMKMRMHMVKNVVRSVCTGRFWKDSLFVSGRLVGARLRNMRSVPAVVRRHALRQAMNIQRLYEEESRSRIPITYCLAKVTEVPGMSMERAHRVHFGSKGSQVDAVLSLLPGVPLLITQNIKKVLSTITLLLRR
jgi:hypothetical protein